MFSAIENALKNLFLLVIRLYWGSQFFVTGKGKLTHIGDVTGFFTGLGVPFPKWNAYFVGSIETVCGLLLLLGLFSRVVAIPLIGVLTAAYLTAHREALLNIFHDPQKFFEQDPFLFLYAAVIVLLFGPGLFSLDRLIFKKK